MLCFVLQGHFPSENLEVSFLGATGKNIKFLGEEDYVTDGYRFRYRKYGLSVCHSVVYPEIAPSVIVAVKNKNKLLLTKYQASHSPYRHYSLIAGYVETGETAEDTVRREVMEEVGLKVKNIRYYKSQPWPFSGALLLGYFCDLDGDDKITREEQELEEAIWVEREQLEERSNDISLTGEMMEQFRLNR